MGERLPRQAYRQRYFQNRRLGIALCLLAVGSTYIIPARLAGTGGWYSFAYSSDEMAYTQRIDIPPASASASNVFNAVSDPNVISPYYFDRLVRGLLKITGMGVVTFFWLWRVLFPLMLLGLYFALARQCLCRKLAHRPTALTFAALALALTYVLYHFICDSTTVYYPGNPYVPIFMLLNRAPANIEFALGIGFVLAFIAWARNPSEKTGAITGVVVAATLYLRPYLAVPEFMSLFIAALLYGASKRLSVRTIITPAAVLIALLVPWVLIDSHNKQSEGFRDQMQRMFLQPFAYQVHSLWWVFVSIAAVIMVLSDRIRDSGRHALIASALSLAALPLYAGATPVAREMLSNDRFSCFYLPVLLAAAFLLIGKWKQRQITQWLKYACAAALASVAAVAGLSLAFTFEKPFYPAFVEREQRCFPAYKWIREHTPPKALFLVDDGLERAGLKDEKAVDTGMSQLGFFHADFFSMLAHRPRVYADLLYVYALKTNDLDDLCYLHWGTFGQGLPSELYIHALKRFQPRYIMWRRFPPIFIPDAVLPVPRGTYGELSKKFANVVYTDNACEIWEMDYTHEREAKQ